MAAGEDAAQRDRRWPPFDEAVLERLADSLLQPAQPPAVGALGGGGGGSLAAASAAAASLAAGLDQLRDCMLGTFVRRYLARSHLRHVSAERAAVNALRFLEVSCCCCLLLLLLLRLYFHWFL